MSFAEQATLDFISSTRLGIDALLHYLNSCIIYPTDKDGLVKEDKVLAVVEGREQAYNSICSMMDSLELTSSSDTAYKEKIISGLKNTFNELREVLERDIPRDELDLKVYADDSMKSISKSKDIAAKVCKSIITRIELLEDKESINKKIVDNKKPTSIAERFVTNK